VTTRQFGRLFKRAAKAADVRKTPSLHSNATTRRIVRAADKMQACRTRFADLLPLPQHVIAKI
jgi:hypothetical protein